MAQDTTWTGAVLTESDIIAKLMHEDAAWTSWTPAIVQSGSVTVTNNRSVYGRAGRFIYADVRVTVTGTGTASNLITVSIPTGNIAAASAHAILGEGMIFDNSSGFYYYASMMYASATTVLFRIRTNGAADTYLGTTSFTAALAANDVISLHFWYESTS